MNTTHSFVVLAYKDSEFIEPMLDTLFAQTVQSEIIITTSTPTEKVSALAKKYNLPLHINPEARGISSDWNFAYKSATTDFVTLAHQDDIYEKDFSEKTFAALSRAKNPILVYTNYYEIRKETAALANRLLRVKRLMNAPIGAFPKSRFVRNRVLSMGCPISCPSVTYNKKRFPDFRFTDAYKNDLDWEAWYRLARESGEFIYLKKPLIAHRIHEASETTNSILSGVRSAEDLDMYRKYWPEKIARFIHSFYETGMESNDTAFD